MFWLTYRRGEQESVYFLNATHKFREPEKLGLVLSAQNAFSTRCVPLQNFLKVSIWLAVSWGGCVL